ncbi:MAG: nitroreductase family protein [Dehalococcoidia bacterium]|nr:nitroreductase family protein [Dehalococcoidia bacterium]
METLEAILTRRSIRRYTEEQVPQETIQKLLEAGMCAPSACDFQPWHLVVIDDHKILDEIPSFHRHAAMLREAPLAILVCGDPETSRYWQQDCSAVSQNILLAAHAMGLGAVWLGLYPREARTQPMQKLLGLPETIMPLSLIALGHPAEEKAPRVKPQDEKVHYNRW